MPFRWCRRWKAAACACSISRKKSGALDVGAYREVVGEHRPWLAAVHLRRRHLEAAHVDAVEPQEGQQARESGERAPVVRDRYFGHSQPPLEDGGGAVAPVVEVAGHDDRQVTRGELLQAAGDGLDL